MIAMESLSDVVGILQAALGIVRSRSQSELNITLVRADVDLKVRATRKTGAGLKFEYVVPIDLGVEREQTTTHALALTLTPKPEAANLGGTPESEDLADSIIQLASEAKNIRQQVENQFALSDFSIAIEIGVSKGGKLQVVAGGARGGESGHKLKLTFRPR
jgi:hypothetical protein